MSVFSTLYKSKTKGDRQIILKITSGHYDALNDRAVALFGFGKKNKIDTTRQTLEFLEDLSAREDAGDALYNLGALSTVRRISLKRLGPPGVGIWI